MNDSGAIEIQKQVPFLSQFRALCRRRTKIQIRERNLLIPELLFPIIYLGFGFYVSSLNFISDGANVLLTDPTLYPTPTFMRVNDDLQAGSQFTAKEFFQRDPIYSSSAGNFEISHMDMVFTNDL